MLAGIHQLHYLPWLRYFEKIARSDVFIVLDNIQYSKNGWQNRNKIKGPAGAVLLTIPVRARLGETLEEIQIEEDGRWRHKHWRAIEQAYAKTPHFAEHAAFFEKVYTQSWERLNDINRCMLDYFIKALGITSRIVYASELNVPGNATERLVNLIQSVGGTRYYSGAYALEAYLDEEMLHRAGIALELQSWRAPLYAQRYGAFVPDLSIVDLLMNAGSASLDIILRAGENQHDAAHSA